MNGITQNLWTKQITNSTLVIDENYGLSAVSIVLNSGTGTFLGGGSLNNAVVSSPIDLVIGQPITLGGNSGVPLDNLTITTTGVVAIIGFQ
jgi:hypothetical protein